MPWEELQTLGGRQGLWSGAICAWHRSISVLVSLCGVTHVPAAASCHRHVSPHCLQQLWQSNTAIMTSPQIGVGSCWEALLMLEYGIWIASNCIKNSLVSQVMLYWYWYWDTRQDLSLLKWASPFPLALFSHSMLQFNWNIKKTGWCTGSLVPFPLISLTWVALSERRRLSVLFACFKLNVLELYHSQNTVKFHLQIKVCVEINSKVPTSGGNVFIENVRGKRKSIGGSSGDWEKQIYYLFSRGFHWEGSTVAQRVGENLSWDTVSVSGCSRSSKVNSKRWSVKCCSFEVEREYTTGRMGEWEMSEGGQLRVLKHHWSVNCVVPLTEN